MLLNLAESYATMNRTVSEKYSETEIFQITFTSHQKNNHCTFNIAISANERFSEKDKQQ
ncbi:hypothetical protein [Tenacibaculum maritimum]|uniref:hypothetical protein n=1 Tax=Tenacibaculum maritimum TaxID=107401 RepID=UPI003876BBF7